MTVEVADVVEVLLAADEPSVVLATRRNVLGEPASQLAGPGRRGPELDQGSGAHCCGLPRQCLRQVARSPLGPRRPGRSRLPSRSYRTHRFARPGGGPLARSRYYVEYEPGRSRMLTAGRGFPVMEGRYRRCGSQQGNALRSMVRLGLADERADKLVERLLHWQWPDGGWNCDRNPSADTSSFMETLTPMRGLAAYAAWRQDETAKAAARAAAEVFLSRGLFQRRRDGQPMDPSFLKLHYPLYWHYDILGGLVAMAEMDLLGDPRCEAALDLLESKRLADGGWPAEAKFYSTSDRAPATEPRPSIGAAPVASG